MIDSKYMNYAENCKIDRGKLRLISETLRGYSVRFSVM